MRENFGLCVFGVIYAYVSGFMRICGGVFAGLGIAGNFWGLPLIALFTKRK
jgi:hypothetical protein